jgi:protein phosphatase
MKAFAITDVGRIRELNQDYVFTSETPVGTLPNLFVVADGMGGHKAGDVAARFSVETLVHYVETQETERNPIRVLKGAIETANEKLYEKAQNNEALAGMGTTMVAAVIKDGILYVANVGDSRLYVVDEELVQITKDHSLVEEMVRRGEIKREEARNHPNKNIITRAMGTGPRIAADCFEEVLHGRRVLMCSDGLTNMVTDQDIKDIMNQTDNLNEAVEKLVAEANGNGGVDNITVVLVNPN